MFNDSRLKLLLKQREKLPPDSRAHSLRVAVGSIFAPGLFLSAQKTPQLTPANAQQRTDDRTDYRMNSAKPRKARPAEQMRQHGLRLIVGRVSNRDSRTGSRFHQRTEIVVPRPSRRVLKISPLVFRLFGNVDRSR